MTLESQLADILHKKSADLGLVAQAVAEDISKRSIDNTKAGRSFSDRDRYDNEYVPSVARKKGGKSPVTLRNGSNRIENQVIVLGGNKATISFQDAKAGEIFRYHHEGIEYRRVGLRQRSIFPQSGESVPADVIASMRKHIIEVLT